MGMIATDSQSNVIDCKGSGRSHRLIESNIEYHVF